MNKAAQLGLILSFESVKKKDYWYPEQSKCLVVLNHPSYDAIFCW